MCFHLYFCALNFCREGAATRRDAEISKNIRTEEALEDRSSTLCVSVTCSRADSDVKLNKQNSRSRSNICSDCGISGDGASLSSAHRGSRFVLLPWRKCDRRRPSFTCLSLDNRNGILCFSFNKHSFCFFEKMLYMHGKMRPQWDGLTFNKLFTCCLAAENNKQGFIK